MERRAKIIRSIFRFDSNGKTPTRQTKGHKVASLIRQFSKTIFAFTLNSFGFFAAFPINCTGWQSPFHFLSSHFNKQTRSIVFDCLKSPDKVDWEKKIQKYGSRSVIMTSPVIAYHYQMRQRIGGKENIQTDTVWCRLQDKQNPARREWRYLIADFGQVHYFSPRRIEESITKTIKSLSCLPLDATCEP